MNAVDISEENKGGDPETGSVSDECCCCCCCDADEECLAEEQVGG